MELFINGVGLLSPQKTMFDDGFLNIIASPEKEYFQSEEPVYRDHLNVNAYRRLSRLLKMSLVSAKWCLDDAGAERVDAIIVGTGLGCVEETENFLVDLLENQEELL